MIDPAEEAPLKSAVEIARHLRGIFREEFGGKPNGRFQMGRVSFRKLCERRNLRDSLVQEIADALLDRGYVLTNGYDFIVVQKVENLRTIRRVSKEIRLKYSSK